MTASHGVRGERAQCVHLIRQDLTELMLGLDLLGDYIDNSAGLLVPAQIKKLREVIRRIDLHLNTCPIEAQTNLGRRKGDKRHA